MLKRIEFLTLSEIRILFFIWEFPISFLLPFSRWLGVKIQRTQLLLFTPLPPACVELCPLLFYPLTLFPCSAEKPCFHMHPSNNLKQRFFSFSPSGVSQLIIKLFDFKFFFLSFCRSRKRYALFVNLPPNPHPLSSLLTTGLTICQEFRKIEIIYMYTHTYNLIPLSSIYIYKYTYTCMYIYI